MKVHDLVSASGARRTSKRLGRGHGSGKVKTSGRGQKGQNSRAGAGPKPFFAGGQNPWTMQVPQKRGFSRARFRVPSQVVNLRDLEDHFEDGAVVTLEVLASERLIADGSGRKPVKLLGDGVLTKALTVQVHRASTAAAQAVVTAGGALELQSIRWFRSLSTSERADLGGGAHAE